MAKEKYARERETKTSKLVAFLALFHPKEDDQVELDMRGLSRSFQIARSTILGLISRNPTELGRKGNWLVIKHHGARSKTLHNVREEGQPSNSYVSERKKPDRPKRQGRRSLRATRGNEDAY